jgi:adenylate kinase
MAKHLLILGPQASGKGTQASMLAQELNIRHIGMGERLREEAASGSRLGRVIKAHIDKGELVPDELTCKMILREIERAPRGCILDGFPRNIEQAEFLDKNVGVDTVIVLTLSDKTAIERIGGRRECPKGHDYHLKYNPPKRQGVCDIDGLPLQQRSDDIPAAIKKRLQLYHEQTEPVIEHYRSKVITIDGEAPIPDVHLAILKALHHKKERR